MMNNLPFLLDISLQWALWLALYFLIFRYRTFFSVNRFYLIGTLLLGLIFPFVRDYFSLAQKSGIVISLPEILVTTAGTPTSPLAPIGHTIHWLPITYLIGVALFGSLFLFNSLQLLYTISHSPKQKIGAYWLVELPKETAPFSFFNYVFVFRKEAYSVTEWDQILLHEQTHGRLFHSIDILLLEILKIFFWWNPLVYIYKLALRDVHEFQADNATTQNHNKKEYSRLLFRHTQSGKQVPFTSHFVSSQLKKRIKMLTNKRSKPTAKFRYLLALPLFAFLFFISCQEGQTEIKETVSVAEKEAISKEIQDLAESVQGKELTQEEKEIFITKAEKLAKKLEKIRDKTAKSTDPALTANDGSPVLRATEQMPIFQGCNVDAGSGKLDKCSEKALLNFIYTNINYPTEARKKDIEGRVVVQFIVNTVGKLEHIKILRNIGGGCGAEVERVLNLMNEQVTWTPGQDHDKTVNVQYLLPIKFKLED